MNVQAILPLSPFSAPPAVSAAAPATAPARRIGPLDDDARSVRPRLHSAYLERRVRRVLERSSGSRLPFGWILDPYDGCELDDVFQALRTRRGPPRLPEPSPAPQQHVFVKRGAAAALARQLRSGRFRGQAIAIGVAADPYQSCERLFRVTRSLLEVLLAAGGLELSLETRSPLITRDLDLLTELDGRHTVEVDVPIATLDPHLSRLLEAGAPDARARLRTAARLAREGISTRIVCSPLLPGITDSVESLRPLMEEAARAGARDVVASPLCLDGSSRPWFPRWMEGAFPELAGRYRQLYGWRDHLAPQQRQLVMAAFESLRLAHGFPRPVAGRG